MNHPPLCPKTKEVFQCRNGVWTWRIVGFDGKLYGDVTDVAYMDESPAAHRFVARYQACAWLDLALEWESKAHSPHCVAREEAVACAKNYHAWREWERKEE